MKEGDDLYHFHLLLPSWYFAEVTSFRYGVKGNTLPFNLFCGCEVSDFSGKLATKFGGYINISIAYVSREQEIVMPGICNGAQSFYA